VGTADHAIPLALQLAMANTAHARITKVDAPAAAIRAAGITSRQTIPGQMRPSALSSD